jgi:hypothetical protein
MLKRDGVLPGPRDLQDDFIDPNAAVDASYRRAQRNVIVGVALATSALIGIDNQMYQHDAAGYAAAQAVYQGHMQEARLVADRIDSCEIVAQPTTKPNATTKIGGTRPLDQLDLKLKVTQNHSADATMQKYNGNHTLDWSTYVAGRYLVKGAVQTRNQFYNTYNDQRYDHSNVDRPTNDVTLYPSRQKTPTDEVAVYAFTYTDLLDIGTNREYTLRVGTPCGVVAPKQQNGEQISWQVTTGPESLPTITQRDINRMESGHLNGGLRVG